VTLQLTIGEIEFETIRTGHTQDIEGLMPFMVTDLGDIGLCRSRSRRVPPGASVGGHCHRHWNPAIRLLRHEQATSDGLIIVMW
jgi:hypothetical protein